MFREAYEDFLSYLFLARIFISANNVNNAMDRHRAYFKRLASEASTPLLNIYT